MRYFRKISWRFTLLTGLGTGLVLIITAAIGSLEVYQLIMEKTMRDLQHRLEANVIRIWSDFSSLERASARVADHLGILEHIQDPVLKKLMISSFSRDNAAFGMVVAFEPGVMIPQGQLRSLYVYHKKGLPGTFVSEPLDYDYTRGDTGEPGENWYLHVRRQSETGDGGIWSAPYFDYQGSQAPITSYSLPFFSTDGQGAKQFAGAVHIEVLLVDLERYLQSISIYESAYAMWLSRMGRIIAHTDPERASLLREEYWTDPEFAAKADFHQVVEEMVGDRQQEMSLDDIVVDMDGSSDELIMATGEDPWDETRKFFLYQQLPGMGGYVVYVVPALEIIVELIKLTAVVAAVAISGLLVILVLIYIVSRRVTTNLDIIGQGVGALTRGDLNVTLPEPRYHDEAADLILAFNQMATDLRRQVDEIKQFVRERQRIDTELDFARRIQMSILPKSIFPVGVEVAGLTSPARQVGGDYYDFFTSLDGKLGIVIADVSGKGASAAMFMVMTCTLLRNMAPGRQPAEAINLVNAYLATDNEEMMFVTMFYGVFDPHTGQLDYVNAGHLPALILSGGQSRFLPCEENVALGFDPHRRFVQESVMLDPFSKILLYTDGVTEAMAPSREMFGTDRLQEAVSGEQTDSVDTLCKKIETEALEWQAGMEQQDDITLLALRLTDHHRCQNLPADLSVLTRVRELVMKTAIDAGFDEPSAKEMELAIDEAVTNVITYALEEPGSTFDLVTWKTSSHVFFQIEDQGPPFDYRTIPEPDLGADLSDRTVGGLGWFLIRQTMNITQQDRRNGRNFLLLGRRKDRPLMSHK